MSKPEMVEICIRRKNMKEFSEWLYVLIYRFVNIGLLFIFIGSSSYNWLKKNIPAFIEKIAEELYEIAKQNY